MKFKVSFLECRHCETVEKVPKARFPSHSREGGSLFLNELWMPASAGMTCFLAFSTVSV
mgnify:CR=1